MDYPFFSEEHQEMQKIFKKYLKSEVQPYLHSWDEQLFFPKSLYDQVAKVGFMGLNHPVELGGQGGDEMMNILLSEQYGECGLGGLGIGLLFQGDIIPSLLKQSTEKQIQSLIPTILTGEKIVSLVGVGGDSSHFIKATQKGEAIILNGTDCFVIHGQDAELFLVVAQNDDGGTMGCLVEPVKQGLKIEKGNYVGWNTLNVAKVSFNEFSVSNEMTFHIVDDELRFVEMMQRLLIAANSIGSAQYAYDIAINYVKERKQFNKTIASFQTIHHLLAEMATELEALRLCIYKLGFDLTNRSFSFESEETNLLFKEVGRVAHWIIDRSLQLFGGNGYMSEFDIQRIWRDSKVNHSLLS